MRREQRRSRALVPPLAALALGLALISPAPAAQQRASPPTDNRPQADAHFEAGLLDLEGVREKLDSAIKQYQQAVKIRPDFAEAHFYLGLSYHMKAKLYGDKQLYKEATKGYRRYLQALPKGEHAAQARQNLRAIEGNSR
jgi:tetratricopeptide (TPR) repeat protein